MDLKEIVLKLRVNHELMGKHPVVVRIPNNLGHVAAGKKYLYVATFIAPDKLHFHAITKFLNRRVKSEDFTINLNKFVNYTFERLSGSIKEIKLIAMNKDYLPIDFFHSLRSSYEGEVNASLLCEEFEKLHIYERNIIKDETKEEMTEREKKALIDKYEHPEHKKSFNDKKEMYLKQTDRNYKDGDRN